MLIYRPSSIQSVSAYYVAKKDLHTSLHVYRVNDRNERRVRSFRFSIR